MSQPEKPMTEKESLDLITTMINKAKDSYYDTGMSAMLWGIVIVVCSLVRLTEIHFGYKLPFDIYLLTLVAVVPQIFIIIRERKQRLVKSYDEIYIDYLWMGFGICIFLLIFIINAVFAAWEPDATRFRQLTGHEPSFVFYEFISPLFLMLYGIPTFVTGAACKFKPMLWGGLLCWTCCIITIFTTIKIDLLLTALSAFFAWLVPGIIMAGEYKKAKKELMQTHV